MIVLEPYEMSGIPDGSTILLGMKFVLEPYEMSGVPDLLKNGLFMKYLVFQATLLIASYFDIKTREVPLFLWIIPILNETIHLILTKEWDMLLMSILCSGFLFLFFYIVARFTNFGGADVLLLTTIGFCLRLQAFFAAWLAFLFAIPYTILIRKKQKEYPFVPFLFLGTLVVTVLF